MKFKLTPSLVACWLALALAALPALRAEDPPPAAPAEKPADIKPAAASADPAVVDAAADKKDAAAPTAAQSAPEAKAALEAAKAQAQAETEAAKAEAEGKDAEPPPPVVTKHARREHHHPDNGRIGFAQDSTLAAGEQAEAVVSVFGSSTSAGEVSDAVVSVLGSTRVTGGSVGDAAVAVLGNVYVNGHVHGDTVAVLGDVELGPDAVVDGQVVCVGGELKRDPKATVRGDVQSIAVAGHLFAFEWLSEWVKNCLLFARPLAFGHHLLWAWCVALGFLVFYAFLALVAPEGVNRCVQTLEQRPGRSILAAVLTLLLTPVVFVLLALTIFIVIGVALIPLFSLGLFFAGLFGKAVMLAWLGRRLTKVFGSGVTVAPVLCVLLGGGLVLLLYTVPILGFIVYKLLGILGLGVVVYTLVLLIKSDREAKAAAAAATAAVAAASAVPSAATAPVSEMPGATDPAGAGVPPPPRLLPTVVSAATLPRAGFWLRLLATLLDLALVGIVLGIFPLLRHGGGGFPLWIAVYSIVMWATKGTTIGGIICGLRVVRLDDRPVEWSVAVIRGLGAFLSLAVAGLGFIWVAFDDGRQSWHDKIAGTTIVQVPKGTSLI